MNNPPKGSAAYLAARRPPGTPVKFTGETEILTVMVKDGPPPAYVPCDYAEADLRAAIPAHPWVEGTPDLMAIVRLSGDLRAEAARLQPLERGATQATLARAVQVVTNIEVMARALRGHLEGMQS